MKKKYRHIEEDVEVLVERLEQGEILGDRLQGTGEHLVYKVRVASRDMQRGKSGGFRVLYYLWTEKRIIMLTIYAKTEYENIEISKALAMIQEALEEMQDEPPESEM